MPRFSRTTDIAGLVGWLAVSFAASVIGAIASVQARAFYGQLLRPEWAPPPWLFGPVWTTLYALMGIAAWLVWRVDGFRAAKPALTLFLLQLAVNALWSWLFFAWQQGTLAFLNILVLLLLIVLTMRAFWRIRALAGTLFVPYVLWVGFAAMLNYALLQLNPELL